MGMDEDPRLFAAAVTRERAEYGEVEARDDRRLPKLERLTSSESPRGLGMAGDKSFETEEWLARGRVGPPNKLTEYRPRIFY